MAVIGNTGDIGSFTFTIDGHELAVKDMTISAGSYDSYSSSSPYNTYGDMTAPIHQWGTQTVQIDWPPVGDTLPVTYLDCDVCGEPTEYVHTLIGNNFALCPVCIEAVKEVREHLVIDEIAEIMES